ncbi:unnamed protein product [Brassica oleracea]
MSRQTRGCEAEMERSFEWASTPFVRVSPRRWLYVDEPLRKEVKDILIPYDRTLLVADPRRCEPKKFGSRGARSRFQKSYR